MMDTSIPYYSDTSRISNSNIGWFLNKGPAFLHKMLTEDVPEDKSPALERGSMIHMFILQPEEFNKTYVVWDKSRPTSGQQEEFCQALANSLEIEPNKAVLDAYKKAYSTKGKSEATMLSEGLKIASTLKDYIAFLKEDSGRIMISPWDYQMLKKIKYEIKAHKLASKIIWPFDTEYGFEDPFDVKVSCHEGAMFAYSHEFHINWEWGMLIEKSGSSEPPTLVQVKCKSLLDGLTLDFKNEIATIYDLKTTQKLWHFEDSIEQYDYLRQLCYYKMAVMWYLKNECGIENPEQWVINFYIIGIDTTGSNEIRVFDIDRLAVEKRRHDIHNAIADIGWHQMNNKWDHSREYYEGDGSENLNL